MSLKAGWRAFSLVWLGQTGSSFGSALTGFVLGIWVFQATGSVTQFGLLLASSALPRILVLPVAGVLVDRWNRRWVLILSDCVAALTTLVVVMLVASDQLEVWHLYITTGVNSSSRAFQGLAYSAATPLLVKKEQLGRANGMVQASSALAELASPVIAGFLLGVIGLYGVIAIDFLTFLFALVTLGVVRIPDAPKSTESAVEKPFKENLFFGWRYLREQPGLLGLLAFLFMSNLSLGFLQTLITPMVLSFATPQELGVVATLSGLGMLVGGVVMTVWGSSKRLIRSILLFSLCQAVALMIGGLREHLVFITIAGFGFLFFTPLIVSCSQTFWQRKIPSEAQGRVFAMRQMIAWTSLPLAYLAAGPLADSVEPLLQPDGALASSVGLLIGVGPGRGTAFLIMMLGVMNLLVVIVGYTAPRLRFLEDEIPDAIVDDLPGTSEDDSVTGDEGQRAEKLPEIHASEEPAR